MRVVEGTFTIMLMESGEATADGLYVTQWILLLCDDVNMCFLSLEPFGHVLQEALGTTGRTGSSLRHVKPLHQARCSRESRERGGIRTDGCFKAVELEIERGTYLPLPQGT